MENIDHNGRKNTVEIVVGTVCNADCFFCFERDMPEIHQSYEKILETLRRGRERWLDAVTFSWWEFTIYNKCLEVLEYTRQLGYKKVFLTTNAVALQDKEFAKKILPYFSTFEVSVHTFDESLGDEIFWKKWFWKANLDGFKNIIEYRNSTNPDLEVLALCVLLKKNIPTMGDWFKNLIRLWIKRVLLLYPVWWKNSISIESAARLCVAYNKAYWRYIEIGTQYIQPCLFPEEERKHRSNKKFFFIKKREGVISNDEERVIKFDELLFFDRIEKREKCNECSYYENTCYGFWK